MTKKIAVLGGGMSALTAVFEITSKPGWEKEYEFDVYQLGWRLGGKGASGRNADAQMRIEEHGLHIFLGFYENAFRVMRECYDELGRRPEEPLATWRDAFKPQSFVVFKEKIGEEWQDWPIDFPTNSSTPGDGGGLLPTPWDYFEMLLGWIRDLFGKSELLGLAEHEWQEIESAAQKSARSILDTFKEGELDHEDHPVWGGLEALLKGALGEAKAAGKKAEHALAHVLHAIVRTFDKDPAKHRKGDHDLLLKALRAIRHKLIKEFDGVLDSNPILRHMFVLVDLGLSCCIGMIVDGLLIPPVYWFKIDDIDFRAWIMKHGATKMTAWSGPIGAAYALAFGEDTEIGAGTGLHGILRLNFTYKGAIFWEMQAGMGDTIFAPLYQVLKRRGVRFHFFHRVDKLELSEDKKSVARIQIGRQIAPKEGSYDPLFDVKGLPCWPSKPFYEQLEGGDTLKASGNDLEDWWTPWKDLGEPLTLASGSDFDIVILGTAIATYPYVAQELLDANPKMQAMSDAVQTTQTQAMQLWFGPDLEGLGWKDQKPIVGNYALWFDTWSDMTHLIKREDWPEDLTPGNLAYLVSRMLDDEPMPPRSDHGYTERQAARVRKHALEWLKTKVGPLWPKATDADNPDGINWYFLVDPENRKGEARFESQYTRGILNPSERYVLSVPGSTHLRLRSDDTGFDNLYMSGDHAFTGINAGCIEGATMSGMQVSQAICGVPEHIVGDIKPEKS